MADKKVIDWEAIELDYMAGIKTLRVIAEEHGISHVAINKRAKRDEWVRGVSPKYLAKDYHIKFEKDEFDSSGFIYVIYIDTGIERLYKIGMSKNFNQRMTDHKCSSPFDMYVSGCYFSSNMRNEERLLHSLFNDKKVRGEWFRLNSDDLKKIATRTFMHG